jgi:hypothetical protein
MTVDHTPPTRGEAERDAAVDQANRRIWWSNHDNLHLLAEWMHNVVHEDYSYDLGNILEMLEKPWHWTDEFIQAVEHEASDNEEPVANTIARRLGAPRTTVEILAIDDEVVDFLAKAIEDSGAYVEEDMFRDGGER